MDVDETEATAEVRVENCEVCGKNKAKYTCPRCEVRTCCLECVNIHKKELECNGIRDRVKFKKLKNFTNIDLLNDYRFLEETARLVSKPVKLPPRSCYHPINGCLPLDLYRLKTAASCRGVQLDFLPPSFERHVSNTSYLDHQTQDLFWKIEWNFPQAENMKFVDERVLDSSLLSACVHKYIVPDDRRFPSLSFYQAAGHSGITVLLKAERTAPDRYYSLDVTSTVRDNLSGKHIIENPVVHVVLNHHLHMYDVLSEIEEADLRRKHYRKRKNNWKNSTASNSNNFLFSDNNEHSNSVDNKNPDNEENKEEMEGGGRPFRKHFKVVKAHWRGRGIGFRWRDKELLMDRKAEGQRNRGRHHPGFHRGKSGGFGRADATDGLASSLEAFSMHSQ